MRKGLEPSHQATASIPVGALLQTGPLSAAATPGSAALASAVVTHREKTRTDSKEQTWPFAPGIMHWGMEKKQARKGS
jgi:hypothetical protein